MRSSLEKEKTKTPTFRICYSELKESGPLMLRAYHFWRTCSVLHRQGNDLNKNCVMLNITWGGAALKLNNYCHISPQIAANWWGSQQRDSL